MIEEFDQERLQRRRAFLESRAKAHLTSETDRRWHRAAAATLLRDAAAVAFILNDIKPGRNLLQRSGDLFFKLGLAGGLQLLYIAGRLDTDANNARGLINAFDRAFADRIPHGDQPTASTKTGTRFDEESFRPPQLLRVYQALAGHVTEDEEWYNLRLKIQRLLIVNATMPVGTTRTTLTTYLSTYDQLANRETQFSEVPPGGLEQVLNALAQRREELLIAARRDRFHWKALLRPAELIDFDLLALLLAGVRRGQRDVLIAKAFASRDQMTALPQTLASALKN